jgi:hypothetical protein
MNYTIAEDVLTEAVKSLRRERSSEVLLPDSSRQRGKSSLRVPAGTGSQPDRVPARTGTVANEVPPGREVFSMSSCQDGNYSTESSRQDGDSNKYTYRGGVRSTSTTDTRLPRDWELPQEWADWALTNFVITPDAVRRETELFRDYWIAKAGRDGVKADWEATWRIWIRRSHQNYRTRQELTPVERCDPWEDVRLQAAEVGDGND